MSFNLKSVFYLYEAKHIFFLVTVPNYRQTGSIKKEEKIKNNWKLFFWQ